MVRPNLLPVRPAVERKSRAVGEEDVVAVTVVVEHRNPACHGFNEMLQSGGGCS